MDLSYEFGLQFSKAAVHKAWVYAYTPSSLTPAKKTISIQDVVVARHLFSIAVGEAIRKVFAGLQV